MTTLEHPDADRELSAKEGGTETERTLDELREAVLTKGVGDPEGMAALVEWTKRWEERVEALGQDERAKFEVERGKLYLELGETDSAYDSFDAAMTIAEHSGMEGLAGEIEKAIKSALQIDRRDA
jgi:hypothetical protein